MASARIELGAEGLWGAGTGEGLRRKLFSLGPSPDFLKIFELKMASFGAFWKLILLQFNCLSYTQSLLGTGRFFGW